MEEELQTIAFDTPLGDRVDKLLTVLLLVAIMALVFIIIRLITKRIKKKSNNLNVRFIWQVISLLVIIACAFNLIGIYVPELNLASLILRGSALVVAIVGFAAQTAISDLICGLLISINKPFEIGDRIVAEGQEPGIVEDITLRHTVVRLYDGIRLVVPNSQLNNKVIMNTSYKSEKRGIHLKYSVSYDTDVQKAMDVIRDCVAESPYTLSVENNGAEEDSGPVYFLQFADSALVLETTIFIRPATNSYTAITDVNVRVNNAFKRNGIEIPYNYLNIVEKGYETAEKAENITEQKKKTTPSKRHHRTDTVLLAGKDASIDPALNTAERFALRQRLGRRNTMQLMLLSEESIGLIRNIIEDAKATFWIEGSGQTYRIHLHLPVSVGSGEYAKLMALSSSGKNAAAKSLNGKIWSIMMQGLGQLSSDDGSDFRWSLRESEKDKDEGEIAESILNEFADDIQVLVTRKSVELVVEKNL